MQSAVTLQVVLQVAVPQTYGAQLLVVGAPQLPMPSHVGAAVWTPLAHAGVPQVVVAPGSVHAVGLAPSQVP
jgi:hypothetical protein